MITYDEVKFHILLSFVGTKVIIVRNGCDNYTAELQLVCEGGLTFIAGDLTFEINRVRRISTNSPLNFIYLKD